MSVSSMPASLQESSQKVFLTHLEMSISKDKNNSSCEQRYIEVIKITYLTFYFFDIYLNFFILKGRQERGE